MLKNILKIIGINVFFILVVLACFEIFLGGWFSSRNLNKINILRNVSYVRDVGELYKTDAPVVYKRDIYGLRGAYGTPADIDLLTMGGSTTDQRYITEGKTWQDVLKEELKNNGVILTIANAGMDGHSTFAHISSFDLWFPEIPGLKPKYILVYMGVNDLFATGKTPKDDMVGEHTWKSIIASKSILYHWWRMIKGQLLASAFSLPHHKVDFSKMTWTNKPLQSDHEAMMAERLQAYGQRLHILAGKIRAMGSIPIFVVQGSRMYQYNNGQLWGVSDTFTYEGKQINGLDFYYLYKQLLEKTLAECAQMRVMCFDLADDVQFNDNDFYDYYHSTPEGALKIGHYLARRLLENKIH